MTLLTLFKGEIKRLIRYKILYVSLAVSVLWFAIAAIISKEEAAELLPLLIFTDTGIMSVMLLAAMMYYEKQEGTLSTTFITPVIKWHILLVKISASVLLGFISVLLISSAGIFIHGIQVNLLLLLLYSVIIVTANCTLGFILVFVSKDFNSMLIGYMVFFLVFITPTILELLGIIPENLQNLSLISPVYACNLLIASAFNTGIETYKIIISLAYLVLPSAFLLYFYVSKRLKTFSVGG